MAQFDWNMLSAEDREIAKRYLHELREPDLVIAPDGNPYLYRWHLQSGDKGPGMYFHVQVASDPERPLHTHPWDNMSVILAGAYLEELQHAPPSSIKLTLPRLKGDVIFRLATEAHRLVLPGGVPYTMTQFAFGPKINHWGFWYSDGFRRWETVTSLQGNVCVHVKDSDAQLQAHVEELLNDSKGG
jgi:hypothetical protein